MQSSHLCSEISTLPSSRAISHPCRSRCPLIRLAAFPKLESHRSRPRAKRESLPSPVWRLILKPPHLNAKILPRLSSSLRNSQCPSVPINKLASSMWFTSHCRAYKLYLCSSYMLKSQQYETWSRSWHRVNLRRLMEVPTRKSRKLFQQRRSLILQISSSRSRRSLQRRSPKHSALSITINWQRSLSLQLQAPLNLMIIKVKTLPSLKNLSPKNLRNPKTTKWSGRPSQ